MFGLALVTITATAATWTGFWAGGNPDLEAQFPGIIDIEPGRWTDFPLCWGFGEGTRDWTASEQEVVRAATSAWDNVDFLPNGASNNLINQIFETEAPECAERPADILFIWGDSTTIFQDFGDPNGDGKFTNFEGQMSTHIAARMAPVLPVEPCQDLLEVGVISQCSLVVFNTEFVDEYFIDPTPHENEEFETQSVDFCDGTHSSLIALESGPASGKIDLFSQIARRFGFAIGLQDDVGCDNSIFTFSNEDDRGSVMWPSGGTNERRAP